MVFDVCTDCAKAAEDAATKAAKTTLIPDFSMLVIS
jgi:hypothetical protein